MFAQAFRFGSSPFQSRIRSAFAGRKPRHRALRFALGVVGLGLLALLLMVGVLVGAAMLAAGVVYKLMRHRGRSPVATPSVGDVRDARLVAADYRVIAKPPFRR